MYYISLGLNYGPKSRLLYILASVFRNDVILHDDKILQASSSLGKADYGQIMLVDDDEDILNLLSDFLENEDYKVKTFLNPFKALEEIQTGPHEYSMIITDVRMPGISGIELVEILSNTDHKIKVVLTSAFDLDGTDMDGIVYDKFIRKPVQMESLIQATDKVLNN